MGSWSHGGETKQREKNVRRTVEMGGSLRRLTAKVKVRRERCDRRRVTTEVIPAPRKGRDGPGQRETSRVESRVDSDVVG